MQALQAGVRLENVCASVTRVSSQFFGRENLGIFCPPKRQFRGQTEENQNRHRPECNDSAN